MATPTSSSGTGISTTGSRLQRLDARTPPHALFIVDYPNVWGYLRDLYQYPGVAGTVDLGHIKEHYYSSHESINPTRIVPKGPIVDFSAPHGREDMAG
jgi:hypothetical protein